MAGERGIALDALLDFRKRGSWPDLYLKKHLEGVDSAGAALATAITYGVIQNTTLIDYYIAHFSSIGLNKISPYVLEAMRMGIYQILFLDRVPDSAAVNESVKLINKKGNRRASGFANGVMRTIARSRDSLPEVSCPTVEETLSVRYSHPLWMVKAFISRLGAQGAEELLKANNAPTRGVVRVNTLKYDDDAFEGLCRARGVQYERSQWLPHAYSVDSVAGLIHSPQFEEGMFYVQDTASQLAVATLSPRPGDSVLDICAAPGGKSLLAAQLMENRGSIVSNDIYPHKGELIAGMAARYGAGVIEISCADGAGYTGGPFDRIICDVPCSGLGIIRKKPDIRIKSGEEARSLPPVQLSILSNASSLLKPGGRLVYSTCTLLREENEDVVNAFLSAHPEYHLVPFEVFGAMTEGFVTLWPHLHGTDGFFISLIERGEGR